jgi:hypothetical protein
MREARRAHQARNTCDQVAAASISSKKKIKTGEIGFSIKTL